MKNFSYKKSTVTTLKVCGFIDTDNGTIDVDDDCKDICTLLSDFNGGLVELVVKVKSESELDEPVSRD